MSSTCLSATRLVAIRLVTTRLFPTRLVARPLTLSLAVLVALVAGVLVAGPARAADPLDPLSQPQFVNPLPNPLDPSFIYAPLAPVDWPAGVPGDCEQYYEVGMFQLEQPLGLLHPVTGDPLLTKVFGYGTGPTFPQSTYPGRTFVARRDEKICVQWSNGLVDGGGEPLPHLLPIDTTVHWAFSLPGFDAPTLEEDGIPVVPHLHGGHTESASDGLPDYWWTPGETAVGPRFVKSLYEYDNDQQAGTLWYHDHGLGITRLNVYAGLAGFYILRDDVDTGLDDNPLGLPTFPYEVPIVIQDRLFTTGGQLLYPSEADDPDDLPPLPPENSVLPEFFGNIILANGAAWPYLAVEPRRYRLRLLNGSDSRFYNLWLDAGKTDKKAHKGAGVPKAPKKPTFWVIGTDTGLLYEPVRMNRLTIGPGERYDIVVDFAGFEGMRLVLRNDARSPFPNGDPVEPSTTGRIMAFDVGDDVTVADQPLPATLRDDPIDPDVDFDPPARTRRLLLFEGVDHFGRLQPMLGVAEPTVDVNGDLVDGTLLWSEHVDPITENPMLDDVEVWEVYNATADAHPIHLHLVSYQLLGRQRFKGEIEEKEMEAHDGSTSIGGALEDLRLYGRLSRPGDSEAGWKDTAVMYPGQMTRLVAKFDRLGRYVWHCHILSHEDHEMMRSYCVGIYGEDCFDLPEMSE